MQVTEKHSKLDFLKQKELLLVTFEPFAGKSKSQIEDGF